MIQFILMITAITAIVKMDIYQQFIWGAWLMAALLYICGSIILAIIIAILIICRYIQLYIKFRS